MTKEDIKNRENELLMLTHSFCNQKLDEEYDALCKKLVLKLGRKREVPFKRGKLNIWAAAVVHTIGFINFLFDKSTQPYASAAQICEFFDVKTSTVSAKSRQIRNLLNITYFDADFSTQSITDMNPFNNLVMVDDMLVPLDALPDDMQDMVKEIKANGGDITDIVFFTKGKE